MCISGDFFYGNWRAFVREKSYKYTFLLSDYYKSDALANTYEVPVVSISDKDDWSVLKFVVTPR